MQFFSSNKLYFGWANVLKKYYHLSYVLYASGYIQIGIAHVMTWSDTVIIAPWMEDESMALMVWPRLKWIQHRAGINKQLKQSEILYHHGTEGMVQDWKIILSWIMEWAFKCSLKVLRECHEGTSPKESIFYIRQLYRAGRVLGPYSQRILGLKVGHKWRI